MKTHSLLPLINTEKHSRIHNGTDKKLFSHKFSVYPSRNSLEHSIYVRYWQAVQAYSGSVLQCTFIMKTQCKDLPPPTVIFLWIVLGFYRMVFGVPQQALVCFELSTHLASFVSLHPEASSNPIRRSGKLKTGNEKPPTYTYKTDC